MRLRMRPSRRAIITGVTLTVVLAILLGYGAVRARSGVTTLQEASNALSALRPRLEELRAGSLDSLPLLQGALLDIQHGIGDGKRKLTPWLGVSPLLGWVPKVGAKLRSSNDILDVAEGLVGAAGDLVSAASIATSADLGRSALLERDGFNEEALQSITAAKSLFRSAVRQLDEVSESIDRLKGRDLPQEVVSLLDTAAAVTPELQDAARAGLAVSDGWRRLLGYEGVRTYLIIAQNADELRATGGFIPGAWVMTLDGGAITRLDFWDTVDVDDLDSAPLPPEGLIQSLWAGVWLFRDAAWFPDFPTSAKVVEGIFEIGTRISVDGTIAVNQWAMEGLLEALGPLTLPDGQTLEVSGYMELLERETDVAGRGYIHNVLDALLERLRNPGTAQESFSLISALNQALEEKQILLALHDPALQEIANLNGWDGALATGPGDFLMVIDSNVGFSKVNRNITDRIRYEVIIHEDGTAEGRVDVVYTNHSALSTFDSCALQSSELFGPDYETSKNACYWDYLRVYIPEGSVLNSSSPFPMPKGSLYRLVGYNDIEDTLRVYPESGKLALSGFFTVGPGESKRVAFAYDLPARTAVSEGGRIIYRLVVQKQSGKRGTPLDIVVTTPPGYDVVRSAPPPASVSDGKVRFSVNLNTDWSVELSLSKA